MGDLVLKTNQHLNKKQVVQFVLHLTRIYPYKIEPKQQDNKFTVGPPPPTPLPPLSHQGGVRNFLLERGDKPEKGCCHFFITLQFNHIYCVWGESKVPFITLQIFSLLSQPCKILIQVFIVLKPGIICTFLIHSGSLQKMLTALFNLV